MEDNLSWLPALEDWSAQLQTALQSDPDEAFSLFQKLANSRMDFVRCARLDKAVQRYLAERGAPKGLPRLKLALLSSSNVSALLPGTRVGALRRGLMVDVYEGPYGIYRQEIADPNSGLHAFRPDVVCLALDTQHIAGLEGATAESGLNYLKECWSAVRTALGCVVIQQTLLPRYPTLVGNNEERFPYSPAAIVDGINAGLRRIAAGEGVYLLSVDRWAAQDGLSRWFDPGVWFQSKQEIHPRMGDIYGDQLGRLLAALRGRSAKCLVLDLDNTVWGGVIGDDGVEGIVLGQGSATGEAHLALQQYALALSRRGVILAVCSKNDEANAFAGFDQHPEMALRRTDIACFIANWRDKASNLREIAERLNIGVDALVFVDDNPVERALIRRELPAVAVPELPEEPAGYVPMLARAGYFEALEITPEDMERAQQYRANAERDLLRTSSTDMGSFLQALNMTMTWSAFDPGTLQRVVQLINKTNQFNLTTRRYTGAEVAGMLENPDVVTLQLRLADRYGDNGMIAVVIGRRERSRSLVIDTWLMSCRVLGRQVEEATLNLIIDQAIALGCEELVGEYRPTAKNKMVKDHYARLGFELQESRDDGSTIWSLPLDQYQPKTTHIDVREVSHAKLAAV